MKKMIIALLYALIGISNISSMQKMKKAYCAYKQYTVNSNKADRWNSLVGGIAISTGLSTLIFCTTTCSFAEGAELGYQKCLWPDDLKDLRKKSQNRLICLTLLTGLTEVTMLKVCKKLAMSYRLGTYSVIPLLAYSGGYRIMTSDGKVSKFLRERM